MDKNYTLSKINITKFIRSEKFKKGINKVYFGTNIYPIIH